MLTYHGSPRTTSTPILTQSSTLVNVYKMAHGIIHIFSLNQAVKSLKIISKQATRPRTNLCVLSMHMPESIHQGLNMESVVMEDHLQVHHLHMHLNNLITLFTSLLIGFNVLNSIMIKVQVYTK